MFNASGVINGTPKIWVRYDMNVDKIGFKSGPSLIWCVDEFEEGTLEAPSSSWYLQYI